MTEPVTGGDLWLRRFHPSPDAGMSLVLFPHAGGSASFYFPMAQALSPGIEVLAVQYPGRQDRHAERCLDDIGELADRIAAELRSWTSGPLALFGHSMGAVLAFEVALRLDVEPVRLFVSGRRAPSRYRHERVHLRADEGLVAELRKMSGTASWALGDEELLRLILPAVRSDYRAIETYRCVPGVSVSCPVTVLIGDTDPRVTVDEANAWCEHTTGELDVRVFPGGHFYLVERRQEVLAVLGEQLGLGSP